MLVGFAEVGFAHCRVSGLLYWIAIMQSSTWLGVMSLICNVSATLTAFAFGCDPIFIANGFASYNACLLGCNLAFNLKQDPWTYKPIVAAIVGGSICAYMSVFVGIFTDKKTWTYPFNICSQLTFMYTKPVGTFPAPIPWSEYQPFDFFDGVSSGVAEIIYALDWKAGIITMVGSLCYKPELFGAQVFGSVVGFFCCWAVEGDLRVARLGLWGFNPALVCSAIVIFFKPTWQLLPLMLWCAVGTTAMNAGLVVAFGENFHTPVNTMPWCFSGTILMTLKLGMIKGLTDKVQTRRTDGETASLGCGIDCVIGNDLRDRDTTDGEPTERHGV